MKSRGGTRRRVARTTALMTDERVPAIFEGAFEFDGIRIRVDVLERLANGTWGLREVKSSTRPKDYHYRRYRPSALRPRTGAGVALSSIELLHVNSAYVRGPGGISWPEFFARVDVTDAVAPRLAELPARLPAMRECLDRSSFRTPNQEANAASPTTASFGTDARPTSPLTGSPISPVSRTPARANFRRSASTRSPRYRPTSRSRRNR